MNRLVLRLVPVIVGGCIVLGSIYERHSANLRAQAAEKQAARESEAAVQQYKAHRDVVTEVEIPRGGNLGAVLRSSEVDPASAAQIAAVIHPVFNPRRFRAGDKLTFIRTYDGALKAIRFRTGWDSELEVSKTSDGFVASEKKLEAETQTVVVQGTIHDSLFQSVLDAGEYPELAVRLADIFAWDLDFYTDPKPGDTFRLVFEKHTVPGDDTPTYGKIFAAEYVNGGRTYDAVLFRDRSGVPGYYTADGKSLQKAFLRSPLKFAARISSHFSYHRYHPVLKIYRPHLGTDYAAPVGTPVQAIANGRVEFSGFKHADGNMVVVKHSNGYESYYLHLSRRLVRTGQSVQQGQRIGLVGATGLATGPHLDFRLRKKGAFVNFEHMNLPPARPVERSERPAFALVRDKWMGMLHQAPQAQTHVATGPEPIKPVGAD